MQHLDEGTIHGWLDGALSPDEAARAEAHVASCALCADAVAEARGLIAASSRILTALDNVPSIRGAGGAKGAGGAGRRSLTTWLVRERIAAVMTLVVAGGALALVLARDTPEATHADLEAVPVALEMAAADSPAPPVVAPEGSLDAAQTSSTRAAVRVAPPPAASGRGAASNPAQDSASTASVLQQGPMVVAEAAPAPAARTDDSLRSVTVATAQRAEARESSAEESRAVAQKSVSDLARRRTADAPARYARPEAPPAGGTVGAAAFADRPSLVQEERMTEEGREVRRRIYRVDGMLVTLDERQPRGTDLAAGARIANAPRADSAALATTIRWTDAKGTEFTLTGAVPQQRLEQIRKLLGYE